MLETEIKKLTAAVERLSTLLESGCSGPAQEKSSEPELEKESASEESQPTAPDAEESSSDDTATAPGDAEESTGPTRDDVRGILIAVREKHDQETAVNLLKEIGGETSLPKVDEDKYAEIIEHGKALL